MALSIVTRAYRTSELRNLIENLKLNSEVDKEIVAVCNIDDYNLEDVKLIIEDSNRTGAKITGIKNAESNKILLLDSDHVPENGLLAELDDRMEDMIIIPEMSANSSFTGKCLDDWRWRNEELARRKPTPYIPVIPRFYRREHLERAISRLPKNLEMIVNHEDSVFYYEVYKKTQNIGFSVKHIFNNDPSFFKLMQEAFLYGRNQRYIDNMELPSDISDLLKRLDRNTLNVKELGFGKGYVIQITRGLAYEIGKMTK